MKILIHFLNNDIIYTKKWQILLLSIKNNDHHQINLITFSFEKAAFFKFQY